MTKTKEYPLGLVLSGGGARGWAHIGVLQALEENGIYPQVIAGSSAGAIVGASYAAGIEPKKMLELVKDTTMFKVYKGGLSNFALFKSRGVMEMSYVRKIFEKYLPLDDFDELDKKLFVCVTNINEGEYEIKHRGSVIDAVLASAAFPLVFTPQLIRGIPYLDGGLVNNLPVEPLKNLCEKVIGVNVNPHHFDKKVNGLVSISQRCFEIVVWQNTKPRLRQCDIIIEPVEVFDYALFDFKKADELYQHGYDTTKQLMPEIRAKLKEEVTEEQS